MYSRRKGNATENDLGCNPHQGRLGTINVHSTIYMTNTVDTSFSFSQYTIRDSRGPSVNVSPLKWEGVTSSVCFSSLLSTTRTAAGGWLARAALRSVVVSRPEGRAVLCLGLRVLARLLGMAELVAALPIGFG